MSQQAMTQEGCGAGGSSNPSCTSGDTAGVCPPPGPCASGALQKTAGGTQVNTRLATTASTYFTFSSYSSDVTSSKECLSIPLKSGGSLPVTWTRLGGQPAAASAYVDGWMPGGAGSVFSLLPRVNLDKTTNPTNPATWLPRLYSDQGPLSFDSSSVPQSKVPLSAARGTTYFTTYDQVCGVYFEYFAGTGLGTSDYRYGRVNRRFDTSGNVVQYNYGKAPGGQGLLRYLSGDIPDNLVPYFFYASEAMGDFQHAPITTITLVDKANPQNSRSAYFTYTQFPDVIALNYYEYLTGITNPLGCAELYDPVVPFNETADVYQMKRQVDALGYQTYFNYSGGSLTQVAEPEGRITYYEYVSGETRQIQQGRSKTFLKYGLNAFGDQQTQVTQQTDPLLNSAYFSYDASLSRITYQIDANGGITYLEYAGGSSNAYAVARRISSPTGAVTYYGYGTTPDGSPSYDPLKVIGPRHVPASFPVVTYYRYDNARNRITAVDPLGNQTQYGPDSLGRTIRRQDARGNTAYFNYSSSSGSLDSHHDPLSNVAYYGYNSFRNRTVHVSPRWAETGSFQAFATYYTYDAVGRPIQATDPLGNITYFDWTSRCDASGMTDALGTQTTHTYDGLRRRTQTTVTSKSGTLLTQQKQGYDAYSNRIRSQDGLGNATYYFYDQIDRLTAQRDALLNPTYYFYDTVGNRTVQRDARANSAYYFYDQLSRQTSMRDALANATYYFYDIGNNRSHAIDPRGNATYYFYDQLNRQQATRDALANPAYFFYDPAGNQSATVNARFAAAYFGYDANNRRIVTQDALGNATYYAYNAVGNQTGMTDARGNTSNTFFDTLNRQSVSLNALSNPTYYFYDAVGNRTVLKDARFNSTYYFYDGLKRQTVVRDALANPTYYFYDLAGNRTVTRNARTAATYYQYDSLNRQSAVQDALANVTYFAFDAVGNQTSVKDARQNTSYTAYDAVNRQSASLDALSNATYYFYDVASNRSKTVDALQATTYYFYDALNRASVNRDALGNAAYFFYDPVGNQSVTRNARSAATYFQYDLLNRQTALQDALGNTTYFVFDSVGNRTVTIDARGGAMAISYDALNRQSASGDAVGNATLFQYDAVGNQSSMVRGALGYGIQTYGTSPYGGIEGVATYFFYDALNRRSAIRDPLLNATYYFYDEVGNQSVIRNPLAHATYFGYDLLNRQTRMQDATAATTYFEYDPVGNQTKVLDPDGHAVVTGYDALNRPSSILYPDVGSAYFYYDQVGNRIRDLDQRGNTTYYGYDLLRRPLRIQDALGNKCYFEYDQVGNLSKTIDGEASTATNTYDLLDRRTNIAYVAAGAVVSDGISASPYYIYDQVGNVTQMGDLWGLHRIAYDLAHRPTAHQHPSGSVVYFEYDTRWNVTARVYPGSAGKSQAGYDAIDRQTKLQAPSGAMAYFAYDAASNLTQRLLGNNAQMNATYDRAERVLNWRYAKAGGSPLSYFDYTRDSKGLVTQCFREATHTVYYSYDASDRVLSEVWKSGSSEVYGYRYAYDLAGNRTKARKNGSDTYYFYDGANQATVKGTNAVFASPTYFTYDKNGSLITQVQAANTTKFAYNAAGLVAKILWKDASSTYFYYDGNLRRYALRQAGTLNYFIWDGMDVLQEQNADGTVKEEYTQAKTQIPGIGQLVETNRPGVTPQKIYPVMDPRGSITKYVQSDGTTVVASREYDAFGDLIPNSGSGTWPGLFGYQGQAWHEVASADGSQKLLLSPTRLYDPVDGRFLSRDSIKRMNCSGRIALPEPVYLYVVNTPIFVVDPDGRDMMGMGGYQLNTWQGSVAPGFGLGMNVVLYNNFGWGVANVITVGLNLPGNLSSRPGGNLSPISGPGFAPPSGGGSTCNQNGGPIFRLINLGDDTRKPCSENSDINWGDVVPPDPSSPMCGVDITNKLKSVLHKVFLGLTIDDNLRKSICKALLNVPIEDFAREGWDTLELAQDPGSFADPGNGCGIGPAANTVYVSGECHRAEAVNYALWGYLNNICERGLLVAVNLVRLYRFFAEGDDVGTDARVYWTYNGWNLTTVWKEPEVIPGAQSTAPGSQEYHDQWTSAHKNAEKPFLPCRDRTTKARILYDGDLNASLMDENKKKHKWTS